MPEQEIKTSTIKDLEPISLGSVHHFVIDRELDYSVGSPVIEAVDRTWFPIGADGTTHNKQDTADDEEKKLRGALEMAIFGLRFGEECAELDDSIKQAVEVRKPLKLLSERGNAIAAELTEQVGGLISGLEKDRGQALQKQVVLLDNFLLHNPGEYGVVLDCINGYGRSETARFAFLEGVYLREPRQGLGRLGLILSGASSSKIFGKGPMPDGYNAVGLYTPEQ